MLSVPLSMSPAEFEAGSRPVAMADTSGFDPIAAPEARVLILGSLPSRQSLLSNQYYGNPRNAFWRVMGELFNAGPNLPYEQRIVRLKANGVAVWDVLKSSYRSGSMDAAIDEATAVANDFSSFFLRQSKLELVCFNGRKAEKLYSRLVADDLPREFKSMRYETLPSTSPAYAAMSFTAKLARWSVITGGCHVPQYKDSV